MRQRRRVRNHTYYHSSQGTNGYYGKRELHEANLGNRPILPERTKVKKQDIRFKLRKRNQMIRRPNTMKRTGSVYQNIERRRAIRRRKPTTRRKSRFQSFADAINKPAKIQWSPKEKAKASQPKEEGIVKKITNLAIFKGLKL